LDQRLNVDQGVNIWNGGAVLLLSLAPYLIIRLSLGGNPITADIERSFLANQFIQVFDRASLVPLGWWMGLRAAWAPIIYAFAGLTNGSRILLIVGTMATATMMVWPAHDLSRSIAIITPVAVLGILMLLRRHPAMAPRIVFWLGVLGLLLPPVHVVRRELDPVENIVIEVLRLIRG
jgi:hypothetical protein